MGEMAEGVFAMKRYIAFAFDTYYPSGALEDAIGSFDTLEEAQAACTKQYHDFRFVWDRIEDKQWEIE